MILIVLIGGGSGDLCSNHDEYERFPPAHMEKIMNDMNDLKDPSTNANKYLNINK